MPGPVDALIEDLAGLLRELGSIYEHLRKALAVHEETNRIVRKDLEWARAQAERQGSGAAAGPSAGAPPAAPQPSSSRSTGARGQAGPERQASRGLQKAAGGAARGSREAVSEGGGRSAPRGLDDVIRLGRRFHELRETFYRACEERASVARELEGDATGAAWERPGVDAAQGSWLSYGGAATGFLRSLRARTGAREGEGGARVTAADLIAARYVAAREACAAVVDAIDAAEAGVLSHEALQAATQTLWTEAAAARELCDEGDRLVANTIAGPDELFWRNRALRFVLADRDRTRTERDSTGAIATQGSGVPPRGGHGTLDTATTQPPPPNHLPASSSVSPAAALAQRRAESERLANRWLPETVALPASPMQVAMSVAHDSTAHASHVTPSHARQPPPHPTSLPPLLCLDVRDWATVPVFFKASHQLQAAALGAHIQALALRLSTPAWADTVAARLGVGAGGQGSDDQDLVNEMEDLVAWLRVVVGCAGTGRGAPLTAVVPVDTVDVGI